MEISIETNSFQLAQVFTISRGSRTQADVLTVTLSRGISRGRGECVPYARLWGEYGKCKCANTNAASEI